MMFKNYGLSFFFFNFIQSNMNSDKSKITVNCKIEFGYELQLYIPYAYYLHIHNRLEKTISSKFTRELYYFSDNHEEKYTVRTYEYPDQRLPNKDLHTENFQFISWIPPPYKQIFKNTTFIYEKPLLVIHNKFNIEWGENPINYLDIPTLENIFLNCNDKYKIVYIRPSSNLIIDDNSDIQQLNESEILKKYSITSGETLFHEHKNICNNFNHFQLMLYANCEHFISVQGGSSYLCSFFGGKNIIYVKKGKELLSGAYKKVFPKFSNCNVLYADNYKDFLNLITNNYVSNANLESQSTKNR